MATEFSREFFSANRIVKADLRAARQPREDDITRIKAEVKKLYDATEVLLNITVDESLLSGYVLQIGDRVFDNSGRHALDQMMEGKPSLATLKTRVEDYKPAATSAEGGVVIASADGIVQVDGMDRAVYGEIVTFENGAKGMVESVDPGKLGVMLFDGAESVGVGTLVTRSGKRAGIPVGDAFLGRVIDPLGEPIDGKGPIESVGYNPIEKQAPGILERQSVDTPLHTGILAIDSMFPIGRGQRELIIGDRQTGKTSIDVYKRQLSKVVSSIRSAVEEGRPLMLTCTSTRPGTLPARPSSPSLMPALTAAFSASEDVYKRQPSRWACAFPAHCAPSPAACWRSIRRAAISMWAPAW